MSLSSLKMKTSPKEEIKHPWVMSCVKTCLNLEANSSIIYICPKVLPDFQINLYFRARLGCKNKIHETQHAVIGEINPVILLNLTLSVVNPGLCLFLASLMANSLAVSLICIKQQHHQSAIRELCYITRAWFLKSNDEIRQQNTFLCCIVHHVLFWVWIWLVLMGRDEMTLVHHSLCLTVDR